MKSRYGRECVLCGNIYEYCNTCRDYLASPAWKMLFDEERCKDIFDILSHHSSKLMSDKEARTKLLDIDMTGFKFKNPKTKAQYDAIVNKVVDDVSKAQEMEQDNAQDRTQDKEQDVTEAEPEVQIQPRFTKKSTKKEKLNKDTLKKD